MEKILFTEPYYTEPFNAPATIFIGDDVGPTTEVLKVLLSENF